TLPTPTKNSITSLQNAIEQEKAAGVVFEMDRGWPNRRILRAILQFLGHRRILFYWPQERMIEVVDSHRLRHYIKLFAISSAFLILRGGVLPQVVGSENPDAMALNNLRASSKDDCSLIVSTYFEQLIRHAHPIPLTGAIRAGGAGWHIAGTGVYLRTDYWGNIRSGGSYGHTCYVAQKLANRTDTLICLMANQFDLLDDFGLRQIVVGFPGAVGTERDMLAANHHYYIWLKTAMEALRPAYIYERFVPGNVVACRLSQELGIPYICEFNGSEVAMARSFSNRPFEFENLFLMSEQTAFQQATIVTVVSDAVKHQVISRGIAADKILVNPNGAEPADYYPASPEEKRSLKETFGWTDDHVVIGFVGTFGAWHGIEILTKSLRQVCEQIPEARFLLIGDGNLHGMVAEEVEKHHLGDRVILTGSKPQKEAARLLRTCDIYVSPHHRNMANERFFGSPTKLFEYMALAGAVVGTRLEQIGEVLSPSLSPADLTLPDLTITNQRSVLCSPGDAEEFTAALIGLCRRRDLHPVLGANARRAVLEHYSWDRHVDHILDFAVSHSQHLKAASVTPPTTTTAINDDFKMATQQQWDNDPCGSHYVERTEDRLAFFDEAARFRHGAYAPWMAETMEFNRHRGKKVLEIGAGMGTDLVRFAQGGAYVTDIDLSLGHLRLAEENFRLRGLRGHFMQGDAENLPFPDDSFDVVYSNGVLHHTPDTTRSIAEIFRVLRPGGKAIIMVYRENSIQYWRDIILWRGLIRGQLAQWSPGEIMSRSVEISHTGARPLVKVYTAAAIRDIFETTGFRDISICRRQLMSHEPPASLRRVPVTWLQRVMGWNLVVKAIKPRWV
ncbi:MAG: methyltransferase domain-containing protein, partial [Magnetospirillum sp.]